MENMSLNQLLAKANANPTSEVLKDISREIGKRGLLMVYNFNGRYWYAA